MTVPGWAVWAFMLFITAAIAVVVAVVTTNQLTRDVRENTRRLDGQGQVQAQATTAMCRRLQRQRDRENVSDARQFLILQAASTNPTIGKARQRYYAELTSTSDWDPPTSCLEAVYSPETYAPPLPVPFSLLGRDFAWCVVVSAENRIDPPMPGDPDCAKVRAPDIL